LDRLKYFDDEKIRMTFAAHQNSDGFLDCNGAKSLLRDTTNVSGTDDAAAQVIQKFASPTTTTTTGGVDNNTKRVSFDELKQAVDEAAQSVDPRVMPIFATLTLTFTSQGLQFPVLPQLARSLELTAADLGLITSATALGRLCSNVPAAFLAEKYGRRPLLIAGPLISAVGMAGLSLSSSFLELVVSNMCVGVGMATAMGGAQLYLSDIR
jgi:hypothetical protein